MCSVPSTAPVLRNYCYWYCFQYLFSSLVTIPVTPVSADVTMHLVLLLHAAAAATLHTF